MSNKTTTTAQFSTGSLLQQLLDFAKQIAADPANSKILQAAQKFLKGLQRPDITQAVADLEAKQAAILAAAPTPGDEASLPSDLHAACMALGDMQGALLAADLRAMMDANAQAWLVQNALPILEKLATMALPLLLAL